MATLDTKLVGILGDRTTKVLRDLYGYVTIEDLLHHYPRRYLVRGELSNISELVEGDEVTILAEVYSAASRRLHARKGNLLEVIVTDGTAKLSLTFFNQAWREKDLKVGKQALFAGKIGVFNGKRQLAHPDYELISDGSDVRGWWSSITWNRRGSLALGMPMQSERKSPENSRDMRTTSLMDQ